MDIHSCINFILSNTQNAVNNYFKRELQEYDITPSQYALLQCLCTQDGLTPSQLAQELRLDTSSITGILSRLEKKGLIDRVYNQEAAASPSICGKKAALYGLRLTGSLTRPMQKSPMDWTPSIMHSFCPL